MASVKRSQQQQTQDDINALADIVDKLKISTLVNAAKISPLVQERTIGPTITAKQPSNGFTDAFDRLQITSNNNNINHKPERKSISNGETPKFRSNVWQEVNIDVEQAESPRNFLELSDCKLVSFRLEADQAEKRRRAKISIELQEKQNKWDTELEQRLQQIRIQSAQEAQQRLQAKRRERNQSLLYAIQQIEDEAKVAEEQSKRERNEMNEHSRQLIERANQLRRQEEMRTLLESVAATKTLFINLFEVFAKSVISNQNALQQIDKLSHYTATRDALLQRYEKIMNAMNAKQIDTKFVTDFETLCDDIKTEQANVNTDLKCYEQAVEAEAKQLQDRMAQQKVETAAATPVGESVVDGTQANVPVPVSVPVPASGIFVSPERLAFYTDVTNFYEEQRAQVQPLIDDVNWKTFRFNCQKAVNTPVNAISAVTAQHLQDKYDKLAALLAGHTVNIAGNTQFSAVEHPLGIQYCTLLLAKKFVNQATTISTSSNPHSAFPIASMIVSIWQTFTNFGRLFLAMLYKQCPFLVPFFMPLVPGQTQQEYLTMLGYRFTDDKIEPQDQYLKRLSGLQRLYSAILITKQKRNQQSQPHPYGLENGWIWMANFLNLEPLPEICATLLLEFIQVCGAEMWQTYQQQFLKLLLVLQQTYMIKLDEIDTGGPNARLKVLIGNIIKENRIQPPGGTLTLNFW